MQTCFIHDHASAHYLLFLAFTEVQLEQKSVPTAVFGGLKDDWKRHSSDFSCRHWIGSFLDIYKCSVAFTLFLWTVTWVSNMTQVFPGVFFVVQKANIWDCIHFGHVVSVFLKYETLDNWTIVQPAVMKYSYLAPLKLQRFDFVSK